MADDSLDNYKQIVGEEVINELHCLAAPLKGKKIVHVNSTLRGGGVAEILTKMVPMMQALGIDTQWRVIQGTADFFQCTKDFHNAIQGNKVLLKPTCFKIVEEVGASNAEQLRPELEEADIVMIHDPQPLSLINFIPNRKGKWIWRCHIDASRPYRPVWKYLNGFICKYDASIFSLADFAHPLPHPIFIVPPSIDPLSIKNTELEKGEIETVCSLFNIDINRPKIVQISRFDRFKDPIGVIETYRLAKKFKPHIQLILAGGGASDDPEGEIVLNEVQKASSEDPDIHILLLPDDSHKTVNALQTLADVVLQKSIKEGFGLTVTEALWKGKPVIGGNTGGIRLQVINWQTGFLVNTPEGAAYRLRYLLEHEQAIEEMGKKGREFVKEKFLITRHLKEYLTLMLTLMFPGQTRVELK